MILEGIVTTLDEDGRVNISPMGPVVDREMTRLTLRPYNTSRTYRNLKRHGEGVLHVTDDVELLAHAAVGEVQARTAEAAVVQGAVLVDACRSYEFRIDEMDDSQERVTMTATVVHQQFQREFFGFNRAKHAVLEAAILATRLAFLPRTSILEEVDRLSIIVSKTAGDQEQRAFDFLCQYIETHDR